MLHVCMHTQSLQSCLILSESVDHSPPGSSVHGIVQARTVEWVAMPSSRGSSPPRDWTHVSYISNPRWILCPLSHLGNQVFHIASCLLPWLCSPPFPLPQLLLFSSPYTNYTFSSQSLPLYHWDYSRMIFSSLLADIAFSITLVS